MTIFATIVPWKNWREKRYNNPK